MVQMHNVMHKSTCKQNRTYGVGSELWYLVPLSNISDSIYPYGIVKLFSQKEISDNEISNINNTL